MEQISQSIEKWSRCVLTVQRQSKYPEMCSEQMAKIDLPPWRRNKQDGKPGFQEHMKAQSVLSVKEGWNRIVLDTNYYLILKFNICLSFMLCKILPNTNLLQHISMVRLAFTLTNS